MEGITGLLGGCKIWFIQKHYPGWRSYLVELSSSFTLGVPSRLKGTVGGIMLYRVGINSWVSLMLLGMFSLCAADSVIVQTKYSDMP